MASERPHEKNKRNWRKFKEDNILMNFTVMLVPHKSNKKPIHFNMPVGVILGSFCALFVLLCFTSYFAYSSFRLQNIAVENARLNRISSEQEQQLEQLEQTATQVLDRLNGINDVEQALRDKVGLENAAPAMGGVEEETIRREDVLAETSLYGDGALSLRLAELEYELEALQKYADSKYEQVDALEMDVDERLDYLERIPSGQPIFSGDVTSEFGGRVNPFTLDSAESHSGLDIGAEYGTPVYAAGRGTVITADNLSGYGNVVFIDHGYGYISIYAHCSSLAVSQGESVERGDLICYVGSTGRSTGNHLHFGVSYNGSWIDPRSVLGEDCTL